MAMRCRFCDRQERGAEFAMVLTSLTNIEDAQQSKTRIEESYRIGHKQALL